MYILKKDFLDFCSFCGIEKIKCFMSLCSGLKAEIVMAFVKATLKHRLKDALALNALTELLKTYLPMGASLANDVYEMLLGHSQFVPCLIGVCKEENVHGQSPCTCGFYIFNSQQTIRM